MTLGPNRCLSRLTRTQAAVLVLCLGLPVVRSASPALAKEREATGAVACPGGVAPGRTAPVDGVRPGSAGPAVRPDDGANPAPPMATLGMRYVVESGPVAFGDIVPDEESTLDGALVVRVFSDRDWRLTLQPSEPLRSLERGRTVPLSRLAWRSRGSGALVPFQDGIAVTLASGPRTSGAGALVAVDLKLRIIDEDPLGSYGTSFRLELAPN